ncbi:hypothetical protein BJ684DRAFT_18204 [Piptocephalis cylindrospora]|uniref:ABC1 atypical kinase-like domain-containing protein n=1 Tax=Piptocephalis cylindrospora TaxID=1907219 RepID=A0A4P9Y8N1_9FUNG|nr:hypothetical protein BJ684DRAFT_18204 [Piptocephalis cylindrospora]|eukprot:RKP15463.1 hypothetical protein BJ684DRAFT_18204 [Piptocephalis cylindrospora]
MPTPYFTSSGSNSYRRKTYSSRRAPVIADPGSLRAFDLSPTPTVGSGDSITISRPPSPGSVQPFRLRSILPGPGSKGYRSAPVSRRASYSTAVQLDRLPQNVPTDNILAALISQAFPPDQQDDLEEGEDADGEGRESGEGSGSTFVTLVSETDGQSYYYNPSQPLGDREVSSSLIFLGRSVKDPTNKVAIKRLSMPTETPGAATETQEIFGPRGGGEIAALERLGFLRGKGHDPVSDGPVLILDWVEGFTPKELVDAGYVADAWQLRRLADQTRRQVTRQIHRRGLVHNDIHPGNIRIDVCPSRSIWQRVKRKVFSSFCEDPGTTEDLSLSRAASRRSTGCHSLPPQEANLTGSSSIRSTGSTASSFFFRTKSIFGRSTASSTKKQNDISSNAGKKWRFRIRFLDFAMARLVEDLAPGEVRIARATDRKHAFESIWDQRQRLPTFLPSRQPARSSRASMGL